MVFEPSFTSSVSGFLHFGQRTKQLVYLSIFSLISFEVSFRERISRSPVISAELASSFVRNFRICAWGLRRWQVTWGKFVMMVFVPWWWPFTLRTSNRWHCSTGFTSSYACSSNCL